MHTVRTAIALALVLALTSAHAIAAEEDKGPDPQNEAPQTGAEETATEAQGEPIRLEEVEVVSEREISQAVQEVIGTEDVGRLQLTDTAEGLLEHTAGVHLSRQRTSGNESQRLTIRGFDESRSRILLNDRNLNGAGVYGGYYVDWDSLSLADVERVELIRGAGPAKYGNTLGGIMNVVSKKGSKEPKTTLHLRGGLIDEDAREDAWNAGASHLGSYGPFLYSFSAAHFDSDGFLRNAFSDRDLFSGSATYALSEELALTLSGRYNINESGMVVYNRPDSPFYDPGEPTSLDGFLGGPALPFRNGPGNWGPYYAGDESYWRDNRLNFDTCLSYDDGDLGFDLHGFYMDQKRIERYYAITDPEHLIFERASAPEKNNWGWRADFTNTFAGASPHTVECGAQGTYLGYGDIDVRYYDPEYFISPPSGVHPNLQDSEGRATVTEWEGAYVQDTWQVTDRVDLQPGVRFDRFTADPPGTGQVDMDEHKVSPRVAGTFYPWEGGHVTGRYGKAYRFPTVPECYWWGAGFQPAGRKDLAPEDADQWEVELGQDVSEHTSLTARGYYYDVGDYIRTVFGYRPSRLVYNIGNVEFKGLELEVSHRLPYDLRLWANYTFQHTRKRGDVLDASSDLTDELVELPESMFNLGAGYGKPEGLDARLTLRYVDDRQAVRGDLTQAGGAYLVDVDGFLDLDFTMSYPIYKGNGGREARWELAVDNILDQHYEEEYGFPTPGLTVFTGLVFQF
jgi:outer membrane receptor protein involved in Fe transport